MFKCIKAVLAAGLLLSFVSTANAASLTPAQCSKLKTELDKYISYAQSTIVAAQKVYAKACPNGAVTSKCAKLKSDLDKFIAGVNWAIAEAKAIYDKKCPSAPVVTRFECIVEDATSTSNVSLGLTFQGGLTNDSLASQTPICMSSAACLNIVSAKFVVAGTLESARCNPPNASVSVLTDAEVQTKINALP